MKKTEKMILTSMLAALTAVTSHFIYIPVGFAKVFPLQHLVNVVAAVLLGPFYAIAQAFLSSLVRNLLGTGSFFAFPGSMIGALIAAYSYRVFRKVSMAAVGEVIGTGVIGALMAYPIARVLIGKEASIFGFMPAFLVSSFGGALLAYGLLTTMMKHRLLGGITHENSFNNRRI